MLTRKPNGAPGLVEIDVAPELREQPALSPLQLEQLATAGLAIERYYRFPQDIEWALMDGQL
jgi:pyruvate,water dikinase